MCAEHQINKGKAFLYLIRNVLLLHHTAAAGNYNIGIFTLIGFQHTHIAEHPVLCMLTHGTGVEYYKLCFGSVFRKAVADFTQHAFDMLTVRHILLATVGNHTGKRLFGISLGYNGSCLPAELLLPVHFAFAYNSCFSFAFFHHFPPLNIKTHNMLHYIKHSAFIQ